MKEWKPWAIGTASTIAAAVVPLVISWCREEGGTIASGPRSVKCYPSSRSTGTSTHPSAAPCPWTTRPI